MESKKKNYMILLTRTVLGGIFLCFGANEIFKINPVQWWSEPEALKFVASLKETGYFYYLIHSIELIFGTLLIGGVFVPLSILILTPVMFNILYFTAFLDPSLWWLNLIQVACFSYIFAYYSDFFKWIIKYNAKIDPNSIEEDDILPKIVSGETSNPGHKESA